MILFINQEQKQLIIQFVILLIHMNNFLKFEEYFSNEKFVDFKNDESRASE